MSLGFSGVYYIILVLVPSRVRFKLRLLQVVLQVTRPDTLKIHLVIALAKWAEFDRIASLCRQLIDRKLTRIQLSVEAQRGQLAP